MISNLAFTMMDAVEHRCEGELDHLENWPSSQRKDHILTVSCTQNTSLRLPAAFGRTPDILSKASTALESKSTTPLYIDERNDSDTVSLLSEYDIDDDDLSNCQSCGVFSNGGGGSGMGVDTRFEDSENSGPSCEFSGRLHQQQNQHYMGGNYFFRPDRRSAETDCHDVVSLLSESSSGSDDDQEASVQNFRNQRNHEYKINDYDKAIDRTRSHSSRSSSNQEEEQEEAESEAKEESVYSSSPSSTNTEACIESLHNLIEALQQEKSALSEKCSHLEGLVSETRRDHNCWKAKMTMAMGSLRIKMESERDDKAFLLTKCQHLKDELLALKSDYNSKLGVISDLKDELRASPIPSGTCVDTTNESSTPEEEKQDAVVAEAAAATNEAVEKRREPSLARESGILI